MLSLYIGLPVARFGMQSRAFGPVPSSKNTGGFRNCRFLTAEATRNDKYLSERKSEGVTLVPRVLHRLCEFLSGQCVEYVIFCEPGAAGLDDSVANLFHVSGMVRVGIDDDLYT